jgi:hypothetical protein
MGRFSIEQLVSTLEKRVEDVQQDAIQRIMQAVQKARTEDPAFFEIPFNPFVEVGFNNSSILSMHMCLVDYLSIVEFVHARCYFQCQ